MQVKDVIARVYEYLGPEISENVLPFRTALSHLLSCHDRRRMEAELSSSNLIVNTFDLFINGIDTVYLIPVSDFSSPVRIEIIDPNNSNLTFGNVEIVNHNNLHLYKDVGYGLKASFFDTPTKLELNYVYDYPQTLRVWYQPDIVLDPRTLDTTIDFNNVFIHLLAFETALLCLPHLTNAMTIEKLQLLSATLYRNLSTWEVIWNTWLSKQFAAKGVSRRRPFNHRRSNRRPGFSW